MTTRLRLEASALALISLAALAGCSGNGGEAEVPGRPATAVEVLSAFQRQIGAPMEIEGAWVRATVRDVERIEESLFCVRFVEHWSNMPDAVLPRGDCWDAWHVDGEPIVLQHPGDDYLMRLDEQGKLPAYVAESLRRQGVLDQWAEDGFPQPPPPELYQ